MIELAISVGLAMLSLAMLLSMVRLVVGPVLADRVVALDLMATAAVGLTVVLAIRYRSGALLDFAVVFALVAFVGTVAFAHYLERGERR